MLSILLLAAVILAVLSVPALADLPNRGTITFESEDPWISVPALYLLFPAEIAFDSNGDPKGISYTCTDAQKGLRGFDTYFTAGAGNSVTIKPSAVDQDGHLTEEAVQWIRDNIDTMGSKVSVYPKVSWDLNQGRDPRVRESVYSSNTGSAEVFGNVPYGYYYVDSRMGSIVMIDSTYPNATIQDKNHIPSLTKEITNLTNADGTVHNGDLQTPPPESGIEGGPHSATVQLGDTVEYTLTVTALPGAENFRLHDEQSDGLTLLPDTITVKAGGETLDSSNYTVYAAPNPEMLWTTERSAGPEISTYDLYKGVDGSEGTLIQADLYTSAFYAHQSIGSSYWGYGPNFLIVFDQDYLDTIQEETEITVTYDCVINDLAVVAKQNESAGWSAGNPNSATLHYGHDGNISDYAAVYSARIIVYKFEGDGDSSSSAGNRPLNGVKFVLKNSAGQYLKQGDGSSSRAIHWVSDISQATEFVTGGNRRIGVYPFPNRYARSEMVEGSTPADNYYVYYYTGYSFTVRAGEDGLFDTSDDVLTFAGTQASPGADGQWGTGDEVIIDDAGYLRIEGLTNGDYSLVETYALPGFNSVPDVPVSIHNQHNSLQELQVQVNIANKTGSVLPDTGGGGVTLFYAAGMILLMGAGYILLRKRRSENA